MDSSAWHGVRQTIVHTGSSSKMSSHIPPDKIEEVRQASDIVEVVSGYLSLRSSGKNHFGLCPFHTEKTPSFSVNTEMQIFHCFGCGAGGNVFTFIMMIEKITFPEAVRRLAQQAGIVLPEDEKDLDDLREKEALFIANTAAHEFFSNNLLTRPEGEAARAYLQARGIDERMMQAYGLGFALDSWDGLIRHASEKNISEELLLRAGLVIHNESGRVYDRFRNRITFAVHSISGQLVAFGARRLNEDEDSPKYINSPETEIYQKRYTLYGLYWAREAVRKNQRVVFVEGYTDVISLVEAGLKEVVATSGTSLTEEHARLIRRYTQRVFLLYDADSAGAQATVRGADILLENGLDVAVCTLPAGNDPDDFARRHGRKGVEKMLESARSLMDHKIDQFNSSGQMHSAVQRAEATRTLLVSVAKVEDRLQQSYLLRELAAKLQVEESILWSELRKLNRRVKRHADQESKSPAEENKYFLTKRGAAELGILEVILLYPEYTEKLMQVLHYSDFINTEIARIFQSVEGELLNHQGYDPQHYLASIEDPVIARTLASRIDKRVPKFAEKFALDCIVSLKLVQVREQIDVLRLEMRQQQTDKTNIHPYLERIHQLEKQKTLIESRKEWYITELFK